MKNEQNGSFTIEAAVIVPIILLIFAVLIQILFYYHDKNILAGAAYETAVVGSERRGYQKEELEAYFQRRIRGKLILFSDVRQQVEITKEKVTIRCLAKKKRMQIKSEASSKKTEPEPYIRDIRKIQKTGERLGEKRK